MKIAADHLNGSDRVQLIRANALQISLAKHSVDYLISSLFIHHFAPQQVVDLLRQAFQCVRRALVISDLERGRLPLTAFKLSQPVFARSYLTRHDGIVSIRRAYTRLELQHMAVAAGLSNIRVYRQFPWRMTLVAEK